jgi:phosphatidylglycerophosphatase A
MVWDEAVAMWGVLLLTPSGWGWWLAAFVAFRIFDIWKPFPIGYFDRKTKGGFGVMLDDALAAVYAVAVLQITAYLMKGL